jgi:hypothetical protein
MKSFLPLLLALFLTGSDAAAPPVNVPFELYVGCIKGTLIGVKVPTTVAEVRPFVDELDKQCIEWTVVWYRATTGKDIEKLEGAELDEFVSLEYAVIQSLVRQFNELATKSLTK